MDRARFRVADVVVVDKRKVLVRAVVVITNDVRKLGSGEFAGPLPRSRRDT